MSISRRIIVAFAAACAMVACSQAQPGGDPVSAVQPLYEPYIAGRNPPDWREAVPWSGEMRDVIGQLIYRERISDGFNTVNFDPIIDGQDWDAGTVAIIVESSPAEGRASVQAAFSSGGHQTEVTYDLIDEGGWRVDNIRTENWSLREILADTGIAPEAPQ